jgi:hypothetical protein
MNPLGAREDDAIRALHKKVDPTCDVARRGQGCGRAPEETVTHYGLVPFALVPAAKHDGRAPVSERRLTSGRRRIS